jgi:hypothetical protein
MYAQDLMIVGASGIIVASVAVWLVWLRRYAK